MEHPQVFRYENRFQEGSVAKGVWYACEQPEEFELYVEWCTYIVVSSTLRTLRSLFFATGLTGFEITSMRWRGCSECLDTLVCGRWG